MKKLIYGSLFLAIVGVGIVGCKKEINPNSVPNQESTDKIRYELNNIPIISNEQDLNYLMTDALDKDAEKLNHYLYEIGLATRELVKNPAFNQVIISLAEESKMEVAYLLDLKSRAPNFYDIINLNLEKKGLSLESISNDMTHMPLTGSPKFPETMTVEKYEPSIFIPNLSIIDKSLQPIISPNIEVDCSSNESIEDYVVSWYYNESGELNEIILGEETSISSANPLFLVNHSIEKSKTIKLGEVRQRMNEASIAVVAPKTTEFRNDLIRINNGYAQEQGWFNNKSEFCYIGARSINGSPPANFVHGTDRYTKIKEIHKNNLGQNQGVWSLHAYNWTPYSNNEVYWNTWERDWNRGYIDLGSATSFGEPVALFGRARYSSDWYTWIPSTVNIHATPFEWFGWEDVVEFASWKAMYRINDI